MNYQNTGPSYSGAPGASPNYQGGPGTASSVTTGPSVSGGTSNTTQLAAAVGAGRIPGMVQAARSLGAPADQNHPVKSAISKAQAGTSLVKHVAGLAKDVGVGADVAGSIEVGADTVLGVLGDAAELLL